MGEVILASSSWIGEWWSLVPEYIAVMVVAIACGLIIGLERESRGKPAGARTLVLICMGSAIFARLSEMMAGDFGDPSRIAAQIVSGIGFLGAGAILQQSDKGYVAGLTTAATIWVTAAVGIVIGSGHYLYAMISMVFIVLSLRMLRVVERRLFHTRNIETRLIEFDAQRGKTEWKLMGMVEDHMIHLNEYRFRSSTSDKGLMELRYNRSNRNHRSFLADVASMDAVLEIKHER